MQIIDGKQIAISILKNSKLSGKHLSIPLASDDPASKTYVRLKKEKAQEYGVNVEIHEFNHKVQKEDLIAKIKELNHSATDGILLQLPLYEHLEPYRAEILNSISIEKDVDGLSSASFSKSIFLEECSIIPATVEAVLECLNFTTPEDISWSAITNKQVDIKNNYLSGKTVTILNNSNLIGKPLANLLSSLNASVILLNEFSDDIKYFTQKSDIVISATGKGWLFNSDYLKDEAVVVDVTSILKNKKAIGDFKIDSKFEEKVSYYTPVPGGVGPVTIACLLRNLTKTSYRN